MMKERQQINHHLLMIYSSSTTSLPSTKCYAKCSSVIFRSFSKKVSPNYIKRMAASIGCHCNSESSCCDHRLALANANISTRANRRTFTTLQPIITTTTVAAIVAAIATSFTLCQGLSSSTALSEPYRATANLGENVILRCVFDFPEGFRVPYVIQWGKKGVNIPIYIWYDGYHPHIGEGYEHRVSLSGRASLNLTNVRESDQGWYECKVFFLNRPPEPIKNGTWVHLDVLAPPKFRTKPPDVIYVKVGESVTLPCETYGTPTPQIIWYKDNKPLKGNSNIQIYQHELQMDNIQLSDIGEYRCTSRNREGSINAITKLIIAGPAVITMPPRNMTKLQGDRVELVCEARALPSNVTYRWFHDGQEIGHLPWQESRFVIKPHGMLIINPSVAEDSGQYVCEVSNGIGSADTASAFLNIEFPARVYYSPTIQYLPLGLPGIVRCFIQASPPFQFVTWTKDRRPFDPNSTPDVSTTNNGSLFFQKVSLEHQGIYRCTPYNIHGTAESSQPMEVLVRDPPVFTRRPKEMYIRSVNDEVSISCDGSGQPKPNIFWRKTDGTKLPRERSITHSGGNLTIKLLKKEDHGHYECVAENEIATIVSSTLLIINNTTPHTPTNVSVNTSYFAATVNWQPTYNGGYEQTFYLSYRISDQGDVEWKTIRVPPPESTNTFTLYNLQSDNEYEFQVYAANRLGPGSPSPIIKATTKPWSFAEKIYPTDASGATYIPTVQKPSGPKPDSPRNLTLQRMAQGWVLSWLSPLNLSVAVAYYRVEYRRDDEPWLYTDPIPYDTAYLFEKLESNSRYIFRVWAYSILGVGESSPMIELNINDIGQGSETTHLNAMLSSVIGAFLFFSLSIFLTLCAVKICNKKKRRKIEKSYVMVTCPVNGASCYNSDNHSVPSKQQHITRQQHDNDQYYRDYWQRPSFGNNQQPNTCRPFKTTTGHHANNDHDQSMATKCLPHKKNTDLLSTRHQPSSVIGHESTHIVPTLPGWTVSSITTTSHSGRCGNNQHEHTISTNALQTAFNDSTGRLYWPIGPHTNHPTMSRLWTDPQTFDFDVERPSSRHLSFARRPRLITTSQSSPFERAQSCSVRGSMRSDGSGQSQAHSRPFSRIDHECDGELSKTFDPLIIHPSSQPVYHEPPPISDISMIYHLPTPLFQSGASNKTVVRPLPPGSNELPSLGPIHHDVSLKSSLDDIRGHQLPTVPTDNQTQKSSFKSKPVLEVIYNEYRSEQTPSIERRPLDPNVYQQNPYQNLPIPSHLLSLTFGPKPTKKNKTKFTVTAPERQKTISSSDSSNCSMERFEYTRDKLLGAVEKVRSGYFLMFNRQSPFRHSLELGAHVRNNPSQQNGYHQIPNIHLPRSTSHSTNHQELKDICSGAKFSRQTDKTSSNYQHKFNPIHQTSRCPTESAFGSGRASGLCTPPPLLHRTHSILQARHCQFNCDKNYEFDRAIRPTMNEDIKPIYESPMDRVRTCRTDSFIPKYFSYRAPKNSTLEQMEQRCKALREEFLLFRRRQQQYRTSHLHENSDYHLLSSGNCHGDYACQTELANTSSSSSSDGFESIC